MASKLPRKTSAAVVPRNSRSGIARLPHQAAGCNPGCNPTRRDRPVRVPDSCPRSAAN